MSAKGRHVVAAVSGFALSLALAGCALPRADDGNGVVVAEPDDALWDGYYNGIPRRDGDESRRGRESRYSNGHADGATQVVPAVHADVEPDLSGRQR